MPTSFSWLQSGQLLFGRYQLAEAVPGAPMGGQRWIALQSQNPRQVWLDFLPAIPALDAQAMQVVRSAATRLLPLAGSRGPLQSSPALVDVRLDQAFSLVVWEAVSHAPLQSLLLSLPGGVLDLQRAEVLFSSLAAQLDVLRQAGLDHGMLNSTSVGFRPDGTPSLTDTHLPGLILELAAARGMPIPSADRERGPAGDVRAFGSLAYQALTNSVPGSPYVPMFLKYGAGGLPGTVPPMELDLLLESCLSPMPASRPALLGPPTQRAFRPAPAPMAVTPSVGWAPPPPPTAAPPPAATPVPAPSLVIIPPAPPPAEPAARVVQPQSSDPAPVAAPSIAPSPIPTATPSVPAAGPSRAAPSGPDAESLVENLLAEEAQLQRKRSTSRLAAGILIVAAGAAAYWFFGRNEETVAVEPGLLARAEAALSEMNLDESERLVREVLANEPESEAGRALSRRISAQRELRAKTDTHLSDARVALEVGNRDSARRSLQRALGLDPSSREAAELTAKLEELDRLAKEKEIAERAAVEAAVRATEQAIQSAAAALERARETEAAAAKVEEPTIPPAIKESQATGETQPEEAAAVRAPESPSTPVAPVAEKTPAVEPAVAREPDASSTPETRSEPPPPKPTPKRTPVKIVTRVIPEYPAELSRAGVTGRVQLRFWVTPSGDADAVEVLSSPDPQLSDLAINAIQRFKFDPATEDGTPVRSLVTMYLSFKPSEK